ncbi:MAG: prephenate dehydratase, partial [Fibrobacterota bacterium]
MTDIVTLGPAQTFSDKAAQRFAAEARLSGDITYEKTIEDVCSATAGGSAPFGVVPIENLSEGFVQHTLDSLISQNLFIVHELSLPVQFSFIANTPAPAEVERVYVQPVASGQASLFIAGLKAREIISTNSNIESLNMLIRGAHRRAGAVIPAHAVPRGEQLPCCIDNVNDYRNNRTRFIVISRSMPRNQKWSQCPVCKTTLLVMDTQDHSGILSSIAAALARRNINMTSIISRPTKEQIGKYHFFIDIEGHYRQDSIHAAVEEINA